MLWIKAFHIIAVVCWFAALFYLPRLFVYHTMSEDQTSKERFIIMERKLMRGIATPSMIATLILGFWLLHYIPGYMSSGWMHAKLMLVALTMGYHHMCARYMKQLAHGISTKSHTFFRVFNEVPVMLLVGIVILVVVKPF
ncbi:MAG: protoporphyrinogen oxidase HemJ [Endozoicomonas sp.]